MIQIADKAGLHSRKQLTEICGVEVSGGKRWKPVPHGEFADTIIDKLHYAEYPTMNEVWYLNSTHEILIGAVDIKPNESHLLNELEETGFFTLIVRNSINQKYAPAFAAGAKIDIVADKHLFYTGELPVKKRQWDSFNLGDVIEEAVAQFTTACDHMQAKYTQLQKRKITSLEAHGLILMASSQRMMPFRNTEYVLNTWKELEAKSALSLFRSFEASYNKLGPMDQFKMVSGLYPMFVEYLGL